MNCQEIKDNLGLWPDGSDGIDDFPTFMQHVNDCRACQLELEEMDRLVAMLGSLPTPTAPPQLEKQIMRVFYQGQPRKRWNHQRLYMASGIAAVFIFGFTLVLKYTFTDNQLMLAYEQPVVEETQQEISLGNDFAQVVDVAGLAKEASGTEGSVPAKDELPPASEKKVLEQQASADSVGTTEGTANSGIAADQVMLSTAAIPPDDPAIGAKRGFDSDVELEVSYRGKLTKISCFVQDGILYVPVSELARQVGSTVEIMATDKTAMVNDRKVSVIPRNGVWYCASEAFAVATKLSLSWKASGNQLVIQ